MVFIAARRGSSIYHVWQWVRPPSSVVMVLAQIPDGAHSPSLGSETGVSCYVAEILHLIGSILKSLVGV